MGFRIDMGERERLSTPKSPIQTNNDVDIVDL